MLLQLQHQHKTKQQLQPSPKNQQIGSSRVTRKPEPQEPPQSIFFTPQVYHETSSFDFHTDGLQEILKESAGDTPAFIARRIDQRRKFSEERVYQAITNPPADFVGLHIREFKQGLKMEMQNMFETVHNSVQAGIWDGRYEIDDSRNKYFSIAKREKELLSQITGELLKRNLDSFREELEQEEMSESVDVSLSHHAKSENYKTKRAENFVQRMREEQMRHQAELMRQVEQRKEKMEKEDEQYREMQERKRKEKQQEMQKRLQQQKQAQQAQKQRRKKVNSEYLRLMSSLRKPLFKEREERYHRSQIQQQKRNYHVLKNLKQQKRPINFQEIQEHMSRYEELRQENQSFRQQKRQLKESQYQIISSNRPYRSKFYSLAVRETPASDDLQQRTAILRRQENYAQHVKRNFLPRTDQKKQQELEELISRISSQKGKTFHSRKHIQEGKRNLEKLHLLIGEMRAKNKLKETPSIEEIMAPKVQKVKYKNYLEDMRTAAPREIISQAKLQGKDGDEIKLLSKQREDRARQKEQFLAASIQHIDIHTHMKGNTKVQEDYLQAARAKMALLKKYQLDDPPLPENPPPAAS